MPNNIVQYNLLISCPGDITKEEISAINRAVERFNLAYEKVMGIQIRTRHWSKDSYAQSGGKPQDLLNEQFVKDCDLTIALFWTRFGTPTDRYGSGTEEEIEIMLENGKQVFLGFSEIQISPEHLASSESVEEYKKISELKEKYKGWGIFFDYSSVKELEEKFYAHLSTHFIIQNKKDEIGETLTSKLSIQSVSADNTLHETIKLDNFVEAVFPFNPLDEVIALFKKISIYDIYDFENEKSLGTLNYLDDITDSFYPKLKFDKTKQSVIEDCAQTLDIDLNENFFSLGTLAKGIIPTNMMGGYSVKGSDEEKKKFQDLNDLYDVIKYCISILEFKEKYKGLQCIKLVISNDGKAFDEDIEVTLSFKKDMLIKHRELPFIESDFMIPISFEHSDEDIFGIVKTSKYFDYESTRNQTPIVNAYRPQMPMHFLGNDYSDPIETFYDRLDDIFIYDYFEEGDEVILQFRFDYLKHNTKAAFPSVIFVKHGDADIEYVLRSKRSKDEVRGKIKKMDE